MARDYWHMKGLYSLPIRAALRIFQFILAIVTIGLFAADLKDATELSRDIYAIVTAVLSALTCVYHCLATATHGVWYLLDFVLTVLWAALAGAVGTFVLDRQDQMANGFEPVYGARRTRLSAAVAIALLAMLLWFSTVLHGCAWGCSAWRQGRKREDKLDLVESVTLDVQKVQVDVQKDNETSKV